MVHQRYGDMAEVFQNMYPAKSDAQAGDSQNESARDQLRTSMYLWTLNRAKTAKNKPGPTIGITLCLDSMLGVTVPSNLRGAICVRFASDVGPALYGCGQED